MNHVKSFEEMNPEQQFAWNAGRLAASQQIAEQQESIEQLAKDKASLSATLKYEHERREQAQARAEEWETRFDKTAEYADELHRDLGAAQVRVEALRKAAINAAAVLRGLMSDPAVTRHTDLTPEIEALEMALSGPTKGAEQTKSEAGNGCPRCNGSGVHEGPDHTEDPCVGCGGRT